MGMSSGVKERIEQWGWVTQVTLLPGSPRRTSRLFTLLGNHQHHTWNETLARPGGHWELVEDRSPPPKKNSFDNLNL